jgi:hypothetical protein
MRNHIHIKKRLQRFARRPMQEEVMWMVGVSWPLLSLQQNSKKLAYSPSKISTIKLLHYPFKLFRALVYLL